MYKTSIMYPRQEGARFDLDYYCTTHMDLAKKYFAPFGLIKICVDRPLSGGMDQPAPYICVGNLYFDSPDGYDRGVAQIGTVLRQDIQNFTDIAPIRQVSEVIDCP